MRGLMAKPDGSIIETPITANFREGLNVLQYFISTHGARKGLADTALKTANSGYLTRRLVDVAQDLVVTEEDCGTVNGLSITPIVEGGDVVEGLGERVLGRVPSRGPSGRAPSEVLVAAGTLLDEKLVQLLEQTGIDQIQVRSPITCETRYGVCSQCYGRDLGSRPAHQHRRGRRRHRRAVDRRTGHAAHDAHLPRRRCGLTGRGGDGVEVKSKGTVRLHNIKTVRHEKGHLVAVSRSGELGVVDEFGRERERYKIPYGATITVNDGDVVVAGQSIANWDPHTHPVVTEVAGMIKFSDFVDGITVTTQLDEVTGLSSTVVLDPKQRGSAGKDLRPVVRSEREGQGNHVRQHRHPGDLRAAGGRDRQPRGRRQGVGRRRHRAHPAGVVEDPRHHRRSAARRGPVRGEQAEGSGDPRRAQRHGHFGKETKGKRRLVITNGDERQKV